MNKFIQQAPNLRALINQTLVHKSSLLNDLPEGEPGIYTITGGWQTGKIQGIPTEPIPLNLPGLGYPDQENVK